MFKIVLHIFLIASLMYVGNVSCSKQDSSRTTVYYFLSHHLDTNWMYKIYLPSGYQNRSTVKYPVIYLLHGSEGDEDAWDFIYPVLDSLIASNIVPPLITVAPGTGTSWWVNSDSNNYETAFIEDLIPEIDREYHTYKNRTGRGIIGYSMGGYGALRYALVYPDRFGAGMILSAAIYNQLPPKSSSARTSGAFGTPFNEDLWKSKNYPSLLDQYYRKKLFVPLFIATGDDDWNHEEGVHYNVEQQAVLLYGKINKEGSSPAELRIFNGGHTTKIWKKSFIEGIQYMFSYLNNSK